MYDLSLPSGDKDPICIHLPLFYFFFISDSSCPHTPIAAMLILFWLPNVPQVALIKIGPLVSKRLGGTKSFFTLWLGEIEKGPLQIVAIITSSLYQGTLIRRQLFFTTCMWPHRDFFFFCKLHPRWTSCDTAKGQKMTASTFLATGLSRTISWASRVTVIAIRSHCEPDNTLIINNNDF